MIYGGIAMKLGYAEIPAGSTFNEITVPVSSVSGTKDVYFVFSDSADFDYWYFS